MALEFALKQKAEAGKLYVVDSVAIASGKTKDAFKAFKSLNERSTLFVSQMSDEPTFLAYRNLRSCYLADSNELNAYLVAAFRSVVIEKAVFDEIVKEG